MRFLILCLLIPFLNAYGDAAELVRQRKIEALVRHVENCIEQAETGEQVLPNRIINIPGYSGKKVQHFLHYLMKWPQGCYLEIGCYYGSTLISALYGNTDLVDAIAIDNWSEFGGPKKEFRRNCAREIPHAPLRFYESDCFAIDKAKIFKTPVSFYFYDGRHRFIDQKMAFTYFNDIFDDVFVAVVDDWNWLDVREGTLAAFEELGYRIHFSKEFLSKQERKNHWWNGLLIAVIEKP